MPRFVSRAAVMASGLVLLGIALLWWFAGGPEPSGAKPAAAPERAGPPTAEVRQLRLGLNIAADSALHAAAVKFAGQVGERSMGKLKVDVFADQKLGNDDQMLEMARDGRLDLLLIPTAKLSSALPAMQYADLPFFFSGREELYAMLDGEPGRLLLSKMGRIDLVGLTFWENGFKQFTANTPIRSPQDFARLRIRTMKSPLISSQFAAFGATPVPIDFHATYQALKDGAVDGQENPLVAIVGMRFHEVQKHLTLSNHAYLGYAFSASKKVYETLSPEMREIILRTARELTVWEREETARREADLLATIRAAGVEVHTLSAEQRERFVTAMAPVADKFGLQVGYDLLAKTEELRFMKKFSAPDASAKGKTPWLVGLDADLSARGAQAGGAIYRGIQLALDDINQQGGVLGAPLHVIARDHGANAMTGRQSLEHFAAMPSVLAVMGGMHSAVITEELGDIHRLKMPYLIPWAAARSLTTHEHSPSYTFRVSISDGLVAPFLLDHALKANGPVAVLLEQSAWGRSNEAALKPLIDKLPPGSVEIGWLNVGDVGIPARIGQLAQSDTRAIVLVANGIEARAVVQAMATQAKPIPIFAHWGLVDGDFWGQTSVALRKVDLRFVQSILASETGPHPHLARFLQRYRQRYGVDIDEPIPSLIGSVHAYDLTHLLARAARQAQSSDRTAIRNTLESLRPYAGVLREYAPAFTRERHEALDRSQLRLARFDAAGHIVPAR